MIKNIMKVLISNLIGMLAAFINIMVIPKWLSIDGYAEYQVFMLYVSYIGLMSFGFQFGLFVKYGGQNKGKIDKSQFKSEIRIILWSQILISVIVISAGVILSDVFLVCAAMCILTNNFISVYKYLYQAWNMFTQYSAINIGSSLGFSLLVVLVLVCKGLTSQDVIALYIIVYFVCFLFLFISYLKDVGGVKSKPMLSTENYKTFQNGVLLVLGSGAEVVFHSIDKFFVKGLFYTYEFSMYCFGITLINIMNIFISAIAQPMYLHLVSDLENTKIRRNLKETLLCFGAMSGCAYYVVAVIIKYFLSEYLGSLQVASILFAIFPAVAVINCLYINLYKATNQMRRYIMSFIVIIVFAIILNIVGVIIYHNFTSIACATTICYYIWLFYSAKDFDGLEITKKDVIFLLGFIVIFFLLTNMSNYFVGFVIYLIVILTWEIIIYRNRFIELINQIRKYHN